MPQELQVQLGPQATQALLALLERLDQPVCPGVLELPVHLEQWEPLEATDLPGRLVLSARLVLPVRKASPGLQASQALRDRLVHHSHE